MINSLLDAGEETVHGSLAQYALVSGQVLVWLPNDSPHSSVRNTSFTGEMKCIFVSFSLFPHQSGGDNDFHPASKENSCISICLFCKECFKIEFWKVVTHFLGFQGTWVSVFSIEGIDHKSFHRV